jgi:putative chitinase
MSVFDVARSLQGGKLDQVQVESLDAILSAWDKYGDGDTRKLAYILATAQHESNFRPITENLTYTSAARLMQVWPSRFPTVESAKPYVKSAQKLANLVYGGRMGNDEKNDGWTYRGRGFVQLTGYANYEKFNKLIGESLSAHPDLAQRPEYAARILVVGLMKGMFTGKKLGDYIDSNTMLLVKPPRPKVDYINARATVNGDVKANGAKIAGYADRFEDALTKPVIPKSIEEAFIPKPSAPVAEPPKPVIVPMPTPAPSVWDRLSSWLRARFA